jgi:hypothetical protein
VGVFDLDEFDVFHFVIFPLESEAPWGLSGVCIDGVFLSSLEFVVVQGGEEEEGPFVGFIENGERKRQRAGHPHLWKL